MNVACDHKCVHESRYRYNLVERTKMYQIICPPCMFVDQVAVLAHTIPAKCHWTFHIGHIFVGLQLYDFLMHTWNLARPVDHPNAASRVPTGSLGLLCTHRDSSYETLGTCTNGTVAWQSQRWINLVKFIICHFLKMRRSRSSSCRLVITIRTSMVFTWLGS
jgi:hypothetical protein